MKRLITLDNFKIRTKLMITFLVCVLIPLVMTNATVLFIANQGMQQEQRFQFDSIAEQLSYNFSEALGAALTVSNYLLTDSTVYTYLKTSYQGPVEYYDTFYKFKSNRVINYCYLSPYIYGVEFYTNNSTIVSGSNFLAMDNALNQTWYDEFITSGADSLLVTYYDLGRQHTNNVRGISLIRRVDSNNILKIDINYLLLFRSMLHENQDISIKVYNNSKVLFDTDELVSNFYHDFQPITQVEIASDAYQKSMVMATDTWNITIISHRMNFSDYIGKYMPFIVVLVLCNLLLPTAAIQFVNQSFLKRISLMQRHLEKVRNEQFEPIICGEGRDEIGDLIRAHNLMISRIKSLIEEIVRRNTEKQSLLLSKKQAELNALQSQVNPHFLSNVLESIRMRSVLKREEETAEILEEAAMLMRRTIQWDSDFISVKDEIRYVKSYLNVQKYRFGDRLDFILHVFPECLELKIPKLAIVTFVENACVHGIEGKAEGGLIFVLVALLGDKLQITVTDTGIGMNKAMLESIRNAVQSADSYMLESSPHIGILNTYLRLAMYYNHNFDLRIDSEPGIGTEIQIVIPAGPDTGEAAEREELP